MNVKKYADSKSEKIGNKQKEKAKFSTLPPKRKNLGKNIDTLVQQLSRNKKGDGYVIAINGSWGYGKSYFIEALQDAMENGYPEKELRNKENDKVESEKEVKDDGIKIEKGQKYLHFDAWKNDYTNDPLMNFFSELCSEFDSETSLKNKALNVASNMSKQGVLSLAKLLVTVAAEKFIGQETLRELVKELGKNSIEDIANKQLRQHIIIRDAIDSFKTELSNFANGSLVIFIDELDRCRPDYTIKLLENIKHIFNTNGIIFILAINQAELCKSIRKVYGDINAEHYLKRFINYTIQLPEPEYEEYAETLFNELDENLRNLFQEEETEKEFKQIFADLSKFFDLELRGQNECMRQIELILLSQKNDGDKKILIFLNSILMFFVMLEYIKPNASTTDGMGRPFDKTINKKDLDIVNDLRFIKNSITFNEVLERNEKFEILFNNKNYIIQKALLDDDLGYIHKLLNDPLYSRKYNNCNHNKEIVKILCNNPFYDNTLKKLKNPFQSKNLECSNHDYQNFYFYHELELKDDQKFLKNILKIKNSTTTIYNYLIPKIEMFEFSPYCKEEEKED